MAEAVSLLTKWVSLLPIAVICASLVASVFLFRWVSALTGRRSKKLMARQLWHLALADIIDAALNVPWFALDCLSNFGVIGKTGSDALNIVCTVADLNNIAFVTSLLIETHIALACFFAMWRLTDAQRVLSRILPLVWVAGCFLGGEIVLQSNVVFWDADLGTCNTHSTMGERHKAMTVTIALVICCAAYLATLVFSVCRAAGSVATRAARKTLWFLAAAVVSFGPVVVYIFVEIGLNNKKIVWVPEGPLYYLAFSFRVSNGLLNAGVYALQSRLGRQELRARESGGSGPPGGALTDSLSVAFRNQPDVVTVPSHTSCANRRAEEETAALEKQLIKKPKRDPALQDAGGAQDPRSAENGFYDPSFRHLRILRPEPDAAQQQQQQDHQRGLSFDVDRDAVPRSTSQETFHTPDSNDFLGCFDDGGWRSFTDDSTCSTGASTGY